ncbi:MAG: hypothetical protein LBB16_03795 [Puniceicoccales bacterium]|jgi:hypothetical protein|nr:hypothetical protein [Puniceicoccales bacterium]
MVFFVNTFIAAVLKISVYPGRNECDNAGGGKEKDNFVGIVGLVCKNKSCV